MLQSMRLAKYSTGSQMIEGHVYYYIRGAFEVLVFNE